MNKKNIPTPLSILIYVGILIFALSYDKISSDNITQDSIVAFAVAAVVFVGFALFQHLKKR